MLKMHVLKRVFVLFSCAAILATMTLNALAAENTLDVTFLKITQDGFVADTLNGVDAEYNLTGRTLYCVELVEKYYKTLYGLTVRCAGPNVKVVGNEAFWFEQTDTPKTGDVMFGSAAARGTSSNHWALVKDYDATTGIITCFEQNWRWNGQAGINRQIPYPSCYQYYTLRCSDPALLEQLRPQDVVSQWAREPVEKAATYGITTRTGNYQTPVDRETFCDMAIHVLSKSGVAVDEANDACAEAFAQGLVSDPQADGQQLLTREQTAVIVTRVLDKIGIVPQADLEVLDLYTDGDTISSWAIEAVSQVTATGLMEGTDGRFDPQDTVTTEQAIALLVKVYEAPAPAITLNATQPAAPVFAAAEPEPEACAASQLVVIGAENMMVSRTGLFQMVNK